jgi:hypothetical protein
MEHRQYPTGVHAMSLLAVLLAAGGVGFPVPEARAQYVPLGPEFQVNGYVQSDQERPAVATDAAGNFVVVWRSYGSAFTDTSEESIQGQRYDSLGTALGSQFQVNIYTPGRQSDAAVAMDSGGDFVVVWSSAGSPEDDAEGLSVQARRFASDGTPLSGQFQVNTYTTGYQYRPSVAADALGNFIVAWASEGSAGTDNDAHSIQARRYDFTGAPIGGQFQVNTSTTGVQFDPAVSMNAAGKAVVVWDSGASYGTEGLKIDMQRYDVDGSPLGVETQVNSYTTDFQAYPAVSVDAAFNVVVAWYNSTSFPEQSSEIRGRLYDGNGSPLGGDFQVNTYTTSIQSHPAAAADGTGHFIIVWQGDGSAASDIHSFSVHAQRYDLAGSPQGGEFQVNTYTTGAQYEVSAAASGVGDLVVVWTSGRSAGSDQFGNSVQGRVFMGPRQILGKKILVKNPTGDESTRKTVATAKEAATDLGPTIIGDPTVTGATLRMIVNGPTSSDQTYALDAAGWTATGGGYRYTGPTGLDGDPVRKVTFRRTGGGVALAKILLRGSAGTQPLSVVPGNPTSNGGFVLTINDGATYCVSYGGTAGGTVLSDTQAMWGVLNATAQPGCPTPPSTTSTSTTSTSSTTSTTVALPACDPIGSLCGSCGDGICLPHQAGSPGCASASSCVATTGICANDAGCPGGQYCMSDLMYTYCCLPCP